MTPSAGSIAPAPEAAGVVAGLLARCTFPSPGTRAAVAVSGGPDSLALMYLAVAAGLSVEAVHIDHGLRPGSASDAGVVMAAAGPLGVPVSVRRVEVGEGPNLEARARAARYAALPAGVLVGHTADDQAETVLLNLLRGAGADGLAAMTRRDGRVQRPILALRRQETEELCAALGWNPVRDPTNSDRRFRRNQVRHLLMPLLADVAGRDLVPLLARQAALLAEESQLLDSLAAGLDPTDARALAEAPPVLARRAIRRWLRAGGGPERHPPSAAEVERVLSVARGQAVGCELSGGRRVRRSAGHLHLQVP